MTSTEIDRALVTLKSLWAETEAKPKPHSIERERVVKRALVLLQTLADEFDIKRR